MPTLGRHRSRPRRDPAKSGLRRKANSRLGGGRLTKRGFAQRRDGRGVLIGWARLHPARMVVAAMPRAMGSGCGPSMRLRAGQPCEARLADDLRLCGVDLAVPPDLPVNLAVRAAGPGKEFTVAGRFASASRSSHRSRRACRWQAASGASGAVHRRPPTSRVGDAKPPSNARAKSSEMSKRNAARRSSDET